MKLMQASSYDELLSIAKLYEKPEYLKFAAQSKYTNTQILITIFDEEVRKGNNFYYVGYYKKEPAVVFALRNVSRYNKSAELHIVFIIENESYRFLYIGIKEMYRIAFDELRLRKLYGQTPKWNNGLIGILLLTGAAIVGEFEKGIFHDGIYSPNVILEILNQDNKFRK